jgi:uncharacterized protein (DUF1800 family)
MSSRAKKKTAPISHRIDASGAAFLAATLLALLAVLFTLAAPNASADKKKKKSAADPDLIVLDKKFKGNLPITHLTEDQAILHALDRLAYGPRPGDVERIRKMGLEKWVDKQLDPNSIDDSALDERLTSYPTVKMSPQELLAQFPERNQTLKNTGITKEEYEQQMKDKQRDAVAQVKMTGDENLDKANQQLAKLQGPGRMLAELSMAKLDRAVYSDRQLEAIMEDFWFNHFNVFGSKGDDRWLLTYYVRDTIRPHTMGKFQDLLLATAKSPAMLFYLDNWMSVDPTAFALAQQEKNGGRRARYQGAFAGGMAPAPGTFPGPTMDPNNPQQQEQMRKQQANRQERGLNENYGREVMELHTVGVDAGYTQQDVIAMANCLTGWSIREPRKDPVFEFKPEFHAQGKKVVMGHEFDFGGEKDGEEALKMLAADPHTAKFISTKLARHFVSDNPPQALVDRMAQTFESSGGDIRSVLKTMIYSPEFWSKDAYRSKVKTPFELVASTARALGADLQVSLPLTQWVGRMGEPLFLCQPPTGYSDKAETWVNTGALLNRLNFAMSFAGGHMFGTQVRLAPLFGKDASTDPSMALTRAIDIFLDGQIAQGTRETLEARLADPQILQASLDDPVKHVNEGLISGLVLGAPEFQRR